MCQQQYTMKPPMKGMYTISTQAGLQKVMHSKKRTNMKNTRTTGKMRIQSPPPQSKKRLLSWISFNIKYAPGDWPPGLPIKGDGIGPPCWLGGPPGMHSMRFPCTAMDNWGERAAPLASIRYAMICTFNCCSCGGEKLCGG